MESEVVNDFGGKFIHVNLKLNMLSTGDFTDYYKNGTLDRGKLLTDIMNGAIQLEVNNSTLCIIKNDTWVEFKETNEQA